MDTPEARQVRDTVLGAVRAAIRENITIRLPQFVPGESRPSDGVALLTVGETPNPYGGRIGDYRFQFEGEDDLLHLMITRVDLEPITSDEGRRVAAFVLVGVPPGTIWYKSGERSHHFYLGHDLLVESD